MKKFLLLLTLFTLSFRSLGVGGSPALISTASANNTARFWQVQSIDTMKYSRDIARQYLKDYGFDTTIDKQVKAIANTGATHVAIATPYDPEFIPFLNRWVKSARQYRLNVWFRGNLSGWENWFGYGDITPEEHTQKILEFIKSNPNLFADGDIFTSCPECENGGEGDPRHTRKVAEYRKFLITEFNSVRKTFDSLGKKVTTNYYSMNADVAKLIMDKDTTQALGGVVTIDHYVSTPEQLASDVQNLSSRSGGLIVLGEWGAPIPDLHGKLDEAAQAQWLAKAFALLVKTPSLIGLNYWTNQGGSTELWTSPEKPKQAVEVLKSFYSPPQINLQVRNTAGKPLLANLNYLGRGYSTDKKGQVSLPWPGYISEVSIQSSGYQDLTLTLTLTNNHVYLVPEHKNWWYNLQLLTYRLKQSIIRFIK